MPVKHPHEQRSQLSKEAERARHLLELAEIGFPTLNINEPWFAAIRNQFYIAELKAAIIDPGTYVTLLISYQEITEALERELKDHLGKSIAHVLSVLRNQKSGPAGWRCSPLIARSNDMRQLLSENPIDFEKISRWYLEIIVRSEDLEEHQEIIRRRCCGSIWPSRPK